MTVVAHYLSTLRFDEAWLDELGARVPGVDVVQVPADKATDVPAEMWARIEVLHTSSVLPEPETAPHLRWVQLDTSGVDHLIGSSLWNSPVQITTIGGVSPVPLAQYVIFAVLGFAHRLPALLEVRDTHEWPTPEQRWERMLPMPLAGATMGIIGYGRIGREIGRLARAHGMSVLGVTRSGGPATIERRAALVEFPGVVPTGTDDGSVEIVGPHRLHDVLSRSDFVVVVVPLTAQTRGMLDAEAVACIKPGAVLIDVARGGIVDEHALRAALRRGALAGAALDVFTDEPLPPDSPWWDEPNVLATPHVAGLAPRYAEQVLEIVAENLRRFTSGQPLLNTVDRTRGY